MVKSSVNKVINNKFLTKKYKMWTLDKRILRCQSHTTRRTLNLSLLHSTVRVTKSEHEADLRECSDINASYVTRMYGALFVIWVSCIVLSLLLFFFFGMVVFTLTIRCLLHHIFLLALNVSGETEFTK